MLRPLQFDIKPVILDIYSIIQWTGLGLKNADFRDESITYCRKCIDLEIFNIRNPAG